MLRMALAACLTLGLTACKQDQEFNRQISGSIAVTTGDFDDVAEPFDRMVVARTEYEGIISAATWDRDYDPANVGLKVENLLGDGEEIQHHGLVMLASGTRGFGLRQYNSLDPDDQFVSDSYVVDEVRRFVRNGGVLVVTDWAYDIVEAAWPDEIDFVGDDTEFDAAQTGDLTTVTADVTDDYLATQLGMDAMSVKFDFSNWAVIESVADDVIVWETADVAYSERDGEGSKPVSAAPLLVSMSPEGEGQGRVIFFSYHIDAQTDSVIDEVLRTVVGQFDEAANQPVAPLE